MSPHLRRGRSASQHMDDEAPSYSSDELISQRVNHLLFINRLTRRKAAEQLGISHSAFNTKINGGSSWRADEIVNLTDRFGVTFDFLIGRQPIELAAPSERTTLARSASSALEPQGRPTPRGDSESPEGAERSGPQQP